MTAEYKNWQEEFVDINFTDQRLKSRFFKIIDAFAASPGKSTWAATGSRSSAKAAYRFFSNSEISKDELLDSISRATVEKIKCADAEWILAVQDTTAVGFGDRKAIQGMGYYCSTEQRGMRVHFCIAVTDQGIPLGIIYQETNTREKPKDDSQTKEQKRSRPIEEKENFRWLDSMRETLLRMPADIPILTVCDREGDFYEFFSEAADLKANFLIRIVQNRMVDDTVNDFLALAEDYDGFVFGTPVHWAGAAGAITSFLDRAFYADLNGGGRRFYLKPAAAIMSARRAGTTATWDQLNKYFGLMQMPIITSRYWNMVHGTTPQEVMQDREGLATLRTLGHNMAYFLKCKEVGSKLVPLPPEEPWEMTNFIR